MTRGFLHAPGLSAQARLEHGFGTRWCGPPQDLFTIEQTHSADVVIVGARSVHTGKSGDALITAAPGLAIGVKTADCIPILMYGRDGPVVGAVHAGWRGLAKGVIGNAIRTMEKSFGADPRTIMAVIGPAIGECCYEVGKDVLTALRMISSLSLHQRQKINLVENAVKELTEGGLIPGNIEQIPRCTSCSPNFHSYRRDGKNCGRQFSYIRLL